MTVSALYNCLSILVALLNHDVNILFSSIKTIKTIENQEQLKEEENIKWIGKKW